MKKVLSLLICLLSFMVVFTACSGGGSGSDTTTINNTQQGAQATITTRNVADDVIGSFGLTNLVGSSKLTDESRSLNTVMQFVRKIKTVIQNSHLFKTSISEYYCDDGIPDNGDDGYMVIDDLDDENPVTGKYAFYNCRESGIEADGVIITNCSDEDCTAMTVTFGESGKPYVEISYSDNLYTNKSSEFEALCILSQSIADYVDENTFKETITGNGYIKNEYFVDNSLTKEHIDMNNFIYTGDYSEDITTKTFNITDSSLTESLYESGELVYSKKTSFMNYNLMNKVDSIQGYKYLKINGTFGIDFTPDDTECFEGLFNILTIKEIQTDLSLNKIITGNLKINNTTAVYGLDEYGNATLTVTVDGESRIFSESDIKDLEASCPQLISILAK